MKPAKVADEIAALSEVNLPREMVKSLDLPTLVQSLSEDFKKLDEFHEFKQRHDEAGWIKRLFMKGEARRKTLDAVQIQNSLLKTQSQVLVLNTLMAKTLRDHQLVLEGQQNVFGQQNLRLEQQTFCLEQNDAYLKNQQEEILKIQKTILEMHHLTADQTLKINALIAEAKKVQDIEPRLTSQLYAESERLTSAMSEMKTTHDANLAEAVANFDSALSFARDRVDANARNINALSEKCSENQMAVNMNRRQIRNIWVGLGVTFCIILAAFLWFL